LSLSVFFDWTFLIGKYGESFIGEFEFMWHCPCLLGLWVIPGFEMKVIRCEIKFTEQGLVDNKVVMELFVLEWWKWWLCQI
jgi:hypothetical protein